MNFKGKEISTLNLKELQDADWELGGVETNYLEAITKHRDFEKLNPKPEMSDSFKRLRSEIKQEIEKRK